MNARPPRHAICDHRVSCDHRKRPVFVVSHWCQPATITGSQDAALLPDQVSPNTVADIYVDADATEYT
ncbi:MULTISPECIES: hypothetical protein [unclassified Chelatococcus]|uniref:hypothetical protein n=1 Tax=unclassified Chelatococcus TaxID=2638111 RepID=UPI001BCDDE11|nr:MULTISPECIES: hypothetical protein [unclassified Chelatococcus]MBS7700986.1 hypothetical protein [Chelatococcus sp. YT9]